MERFALDIPCMWGTTPLLPSERTVVSANNAGGDLPNGAQLTCRTVPL
ncbi:hypothetical protein SCOCK_610004 [Actinacidiphila cocklensis]|uniref:Uncharacterized protein n=1 Tax=Actinacidiphila cocklensis TaxID=887465 RepID=A0A9W4GV57_9ACTN|nr:hypothetical protein SCOCK_610004 [Actinacidiphila cocklensis]